LKELAEIAGREGIPVISDEIYERFSYDGPCESIAAYCPGSLVLGGFSKSYAMTGWRLGYAAADEPLAELIEKMTTIQQYTFVCAPTPFQKAAVAAMDYDTGDLIAGYRRKRDLLCEALCGKFELAKPSGAFYAFVKAPGGRASEFVEKAVAEGVLIIPGKVFSETDTHFRISYATGDDLIRRGAGILCGLA
jgi:aspartate aminotransferase/aminotransferase